MSKKLIFTVNTTYNLQDVGPDFFKGEVEVEDDWAKVFIEQGRAVEVVPEPVADDSGESDVAGEVVDGSSETTETEPGEGVQLGGLDTDSASPVVTKAKKK